MDRLPAYDDHFHMSPHGRNIVALKEFEAEGGTGITLVTLPHTEIPITEGADFARSYEVTYGLARRAREETSVEVNVAVGPYPVLLVALAEQHGLEEAEAMLMRGMDDAAKAVQEGKAVAIGEVGRPHFECTEDIRDASNRILCHGMQLAKENGIPVIVHCENASGTDLGLSQFARKAGLDPSLVIKHSSLPLVTEEETCGIMPSIPASRTYIKEALGKGTDRFMIETDYIDDPSRPTSIMACTTVPNKVRWMVASSICSEDTVYRICRDLPDTYYKR